MHVDNHIIWVDPDEHQSLLVGNDGGLYRSFDRGATWIFFANLPLRAVLRRRRRTTRRRSTTSTAALQDNNSLGGPSRTRSEHGILNQDWFVTQGGDGFVSHVDPEDPNTIYAELQHGVIVRYDKRTGERIGIQPQEDEGRRAAALELGLAVHHLARTRTRACTSARRRSTASDDRGNSLEGRLAGPDAAARSQHAAGDGQGLGTGRGREEHVDGALRQHLGDRRESRRRKGCSTSAPTTAWCR